jgi:hypothetical protein
MYLSLASFIFILNIYILLCENFYYFVTVVFTGYSNIAVDAEKSTRSGLTLDLKSSPFFIIISLLINYSIFYNLYFSLYGEGL